MKILSVFLTLVTSKALTPEVSAETPTQTRTKFTRVKGPEHNLKYISRRSWSFATWLQTKAFKSLLQTKNNNKISLKKNLKWVLQKPFF